MGSKYPCSIPFSACDFIWGFQKHPTGWHL
jgi:hypothetical protein